MAEPELIAPLVQPAEAGARSVLPRLALLIVLLCVMAVATYALFFTPYGAQLRENPHVAGVHFRAWVQRHHLIAPGILLLLYIVGTLSLMPVWWLQILAGYGFGLWLGISYSLVGATLAAVTSFLTARILVGNYVHTRLETKDTKLRLLHKRFEVKHAKLRALDEKMGHNGLLIVMAARLMHFLPFGVSNYLFGISRITLMDVVIGTFLGNAPAITFYVAVGAGIHPFRNWRFMVCLTIANILLLVPVALRYWRPQWFKRIGVE